MTTRLAGRTALVTGSTSNIGKAIAIGLGAEGAHVVVAGRDEERGRAVVRTIEDAGGMATLVLAELDGTPGASYRLAESAIAAAGGRIDILVNNAAIYPVAPTTDTDSDTFDRVYAINVKAPFFLTAALAPAMAERGEGAIVNIGSWIARLAIPIGALYSSSKGALEALTRAWAAEYGPRGVRVNMVAPGVIAEASASERGGIMMQGTPAGTAGRPEAVAAAVAYLAGDDASFLHGAVLPVDGGRTAAAVVATPL